MPSTSSHGQDARAAFNELFRRFRPLLREAGFRRTRASTSYLIGGPNPGLLSFQKSWSSITQEVEFTISIGVWSRRLAAFHATMSEQPPVPEWPSIMDCHWRRRLGFLMPEHDDVWWTISDQTEVDELERELTPILTEIALPTLQGRISDEALRDVWLKGTDVGISDFDRLRHLTVLLAELGPRERLDEAAKDFYRLGMGRPSEPLVREHLMGLGLDLSRFPGAEVRASPQREVTSRAPRSSGGTLRMGANDTTHVPERRGPARGDRESHPQQLETTRSQEGTMDREEETTVALPNRWRITIPAAFEQQRDRQRRWISGDATRSVFVSILNVRDRSGRPPEPDELMEEPEPGGRLVEFRGEGIVRRATVRQDPDAEAGEFELLGHTAIRGSVAVCRISFLGPERERWAIETWQSLRPDSNGVAA